MTVLNESTWGINMATCEAYCSNDKIPYPVCYLHLQYVLGANVNEALELPIILKLYNELLPAMDCIDRSIAIRNG